MIKNGKTLAERKERKGKLPDEMHVNKNMKIHEHF